MMKGKGVTTVLRSKSRRGFRGYPLATVAFYGPDNRRASKVTVGIIADESEVVADMKRWLSENEDVRSDPVIAAEIAEFVQGHGARSVVMSDGLLGCPHEEGLDYPLGVACPQCPYWEGRDRFTRKK